MLMPRFSSVCARACVCVCVLPRLSDDGMQQSRVENFNSSCAAMGVVLRRAGFSASLVCKAMGRGLPWVWRGKGVHVDES